MPTSFEETIKRYEKRTEMNDPLGIYNLGCRYALGRLGLPQNVAKALELWHQGAELGNAEAYYSIGHAYRNGEGVERDDKKATHYFELAAMGGNVEARHNLACLEGRAGNTDKALKHFMLAVKGGYAASLGIIKLMYIEGEATKDEYAKALRSYQAYLDEIKSEQRDEAAVADGNKYYESAV